MNYFIIFKPEIAVKLIRKGFPLIRTEPSRKHPGSIVYVFENTLEFQLAFQEIMESI